MTPYDFVHLAMLAVGSEIRGKTKLQKTIYFLGLLTGQLEELGFRAHYYGPYSDDISDAASTLEGLGFVSSSIASVGSVDPAGFEIRRTDYRLTEEGRAIAETKARQHSGLFERLKQAVVGMRQAGDLDYMELSIAAKTDFMLREKKASVTDAELEQLARCFGWNVSAQQIARAAAYLDKLMPAESSPA